jgi:hypothetical protein
MKLKKERMEEKKKKVTEKVLSAEAECIQNNILPLTDYYHRTV